MEETPQVFDPFAEDYTPRVDNGELARIFDRVDSMAAAVEEMRRELEASSAKQAQETLDTLARVNSVISDFQKNAAIALNAMIKTAHEAIDKKLSEEA